MAERPKTTPTGADVEAFLSRVADEKRQADARKVRDMMRAITGEPAVMWGTSIVGFGSYRYRYQSGHSGEARLAGFAPRKPHLVVYLLGEFAERYKKLLAKLGPYKTGKGCLNIKRLADVDVEVLRELIERSVRVRRGVDRASHA